MTTPEAAPQHTPEPWYSRQATGTCDTHIIGEGEGVCIVPLRFSRGARHAGNVALLKAAPGLLAALEGLVALTFTTDDMRLMARAVGRTSAAADAYVAKADAIDRKIDEARAAIERARGGQR